jgi:hypothetical protein
VRDGLKALASQSRKLMADSVRAAVADSLDIDAAFARTHAEDNRWDYLLGHGPTSRVFALEPHSAHEGEISVVIKKKKAALQQLNAHLDPRARISRWLWVASGKVDFLSTEKAYLRLSQSGITFVGKGVQEKHLQ